MHNHGSPCTRQVVTEQGLVARSEEFEHIISSADRTALRTFCATKQQEAAAAAPEEAETWSFLSVLFEDDARRQLLSKLGFAEAMAAAGGPSRTASMALGGAEQQLAAAVEHLKVDGGWLACVGCADGVMLCVAVVQLWCECVHGSCLLSCTAVSLVVCLGTCPSVWLCCGMPSVPAC